jgi:hypothetical protein
MIELWRIETGSGVRIPLDCHMSNELWNTKYGKGSSIRTLGLELGIQMMLN